LNELIDLKTQSELIKLKESGKLVSEILKVTKSKAQVGVTTKELDDIAYKTVLSYGAEPAFLGYRGYPATACISVNNELVHGIPSHKKILKEGDIVTIDIGVKYNGFYGDVAQTVPIGKISSSREKLLKIGYSCFNEAIKQCYKTKRVGDISHSIQVYAEKNGYSVIRDYVGHTIGRKLHEEPNIPNFGAAGTGPRLFPGMVIAIEPMLAEGNYKVRTLDDGWTVITEDGKDCVHFEHMIAITDTEPEILTTY
jgi:methionyl aminopeptidase